MVQLLRHGLIFCVWLLAVARTLLAQSASSVDETYFVRQLYPLMIAVQCNLCHNDNGVASDTELEFPPAAATQEQVTAFGLKLMDFVDRQHLEDSLLFLKPTNREEHTGGERIKPGSNEERILLAWIRYLAGLSEQQVREARQRIARSEQRKLETLTIRRLSHSQYNHTVADLLGDYSQPANRFPQEDFIRGFKNQLEGQGISPLQAEAYGAAAERLARGAFRGGDRQGLIPGQPTSPTDPSCAEDFVRRFGRSAFRRPLSDEEVGAYVELLLDEARRTDAFLDGARLVVETMLQSPHFLFRLERASEGPLRQYELASRLSYFLWDTMPDGALLAAAQAGELATRRQVEAVVRWMLDDPRAERSMNEFLAQWMRLDRVLNATRDRRAYPDFGSELAAAMAEETRRLFNFLVWEDKNFMEFFSANYTFVNSELARLYGLPEPTEEFARVEYPDDSGRAGVLGHASLLVLTSKPAETSPTERGLFVRNHFLGQEVPPPPAGVNTNLPAVTEASPMTNRQRLAIHLNSEACAGCHRLIDPIGFGFEHYDAIGRYRDSISLQFGGRNNRKTLQLDVDSSAHVQGVQESSFDTPRELGRILTENEACQRCVVKQLFRYTFGREETSDDHPIIDGLLESFRASGFRFRELLVAMATCKLFLQEGLDSP
jgi:hypothetical protein